MAAREHRPEEGRGDEEVAIHAHEECNLREAFATGGRDVAGCAPMSRTTSSAVLAGMVQREASYEWGKCINFLDNKRPHPRWNLSTACRPSFYGIEGSSDKPPCHASIARPRTGCRARTYDLSSDGKIFGGGDVYPVRIYSPEYNEISMGGQCGPKHRALLYKSTLIILAEE